MIVEILYVVGLAAVGAALRCSEGYLDVLLSTGSSIMSFLEALVGAPVIFIVCAILSRIALRIHHRNLSYCGEYGISASPSVSTLPSARAGPLVLTYCNERILTKGCAE